MTGISPTRVSHRLNVALSAKPVRKKVRRFHPDRHLVIQTEVDNLLQNGFYQSSYVPGMAGQRGGYPKEREQIESMCGLHGPQ